MKANPAGEITHSFLQLVSDLFCFILSLPVWFYIELSKKFSKPTPENGKIGRFSLENHFRPTLKISYSVLLNSYPKNFYPKDLLYKL